MEEEELDESVVGSLQEEALDDSGIDPGCDEEAYQDEDFAEPPAPNDGDDVFAFQQPAEMTEQPEEKGEVSQVAVTPAEMASSSRSRANSSAGASSTAPSATEDLNKRYIAMLNSGRLASRKKSELSEAGSLWGTAGRREAAALSDCPSGTRSVHDADLNRLMTSASLEVAPVSRTFRPPELTMRTSTSQSFEKSRSPQRMGSAQFRVALLAASAPTTPSARKLLSPGPGAYDPAAERSSTAGPFKYSFGTSRQRPSQGCLPDTASPGPVYNPQKEASSTLHNPVQIAFARKDVGSRFSLSANIPSNAPQRNPGPGNYAARTVPSGGRVEPGADAPKAVFGKSQKLISPERSLSGGVFISEGHAKHENMSLHSPGPGIYSPQYDITHHSSSRYSLAAKNGSHFDVFLDPSKQPSPGPIYSQTTLDSRGSRTWGDEPKATFGRSRKQWDPENLSSSTFISKDHALHSNLSLHSPGPVYLPEMPQAHTRAPHLSSGPADRFYDRLEPGRLA